MNPDQFSVLLEKIESVQKSIDILSDDREHDVKKVEEIKEEMGEIRMRLGAVEGQVDELRKMVTNQGNKIQNKVAETLQPLTEAIEDKQVVEYKGKSFWSFLKRR